MPNTYWLPFDFQTTTSGFLHQWRVKLPQAQGALPNFRVARPPPCLAFCWYTTLPNIVRKHIRWGGGWHCGQTLWHEEVPNECAKIHRRRLEINLLVETKSPQRCSMGLSCPDNAFKEQCERKEQPIYASWLVCLFSLLAPYANNMHGLVFFYKVTLYTMEVWLATILL